MHNTERLKGLDVFVAVAAAGSFTAAAQRLNLTSSAVGKAIGRLEARLNTRLFERTTRRLRLTDAGHKFHRSCVQVLDDIAAAERDLITDDEQPSGRLQLELPATFGHLQVMPVLLDFLERYPGIAPHIMFSDRFIDVVEDGVDMAVRIGGANSWPANVGRRFLGNERLIFCAAPAYLAQRGMPQSIAQLNQHSVVTYGRSSGEPGSWLVATDAGLVERRYVESRAVVGHAQAQLDAVLAGLGVAQMATWLVEPHLRSGQLVAILPDCDIDGLPLHLLWPVSKQHNPKISRLLTHLQDTLRIR